MSTFNLADVVNPGGDRVWNVEHRPNSEKTPVRLELRQRTIAKRDGHTPLSFTKLLGFTNTIADEKALEEAARELLIRVGNVDKLVGVYEN